MLCCHNARLQALPLVKLDFLQVAAATVPTTQIPGLSLSKVPAGLPPMTRMLLEVRCIRQKDSLLVLKPETTQLLQVGFTSVICVTVAACMYVYARRTVSRLQSTATGTVLTESALRVTSSAWMAPRVFVPCMVCVRVA
jgi:hypothetical protein